MSGNIIKTIMKTERLYCITGYTPENINSFIDKLEQIVSNSKYAMIQVRSKHFSLPQYKQIIETIMPLAKQKQVKILVNSDMITNNRCETWRAEREVE